MTEAWVGMLRPLDHSLFEVPVSEAALDCLWATPFDHANVTAQLQRMTRGDRRCGESSIEMWALCALAPHGEELPHVGVPEDYDNEVGPLIAVTVCWGSVR